eukprot:3878227-Rhodomonas_salina.1
MAAEQSRQNIKKITHDDCEAMGLLEQAIASLDATLVQAGAVADSWGKTLFPGIHRFPLHTHYWKTLCGTTICTQSRYFIRGGCFGSSRTSSGRTLPVGLGSISNSGNLTLPRLVSTGPKVPVAMRLGESESDTQPQ